jgi:hypothetical protein
LVWCSWWLWNMSKLLVIIWLVVARTVSSTLWLMFRVIRVNGLVDLLITWGHSFFQKLKTSSSFLNILTTVVCRDHAISLRSGVGIIALRTKSTLVTWLIVVTQVHVLLVHASMILILIAAAVITSSYSIVLNCMQTWLSITILLSDAQPCANLVIGGFTLTVMWSLMAYLIVGIVVVLSFCDLSISYSRVPLWPIQY